MLTFPWVVVTRREAREDGDIGCYEIWENTGRTYSRCIADCTDEYEALRIVDALEKALPK